MAKIIKPEDVIGTYEDGEIVNCLCGKEQFVPFQYRDCSFVVEPEQCDNCEGDEFEITHRAKRFICPVCDGENILALEPTEIVHDDDITYVVHCSVGEVFCSHCDEEFYSAVLVNNPKDSPETWRRVLCRSFGEKA